MTDHDQLFKQLLEEFFDQLLQLIEPRLADQLEPGEATFLKQDVFSGIGEGDRAIVDLVAKIPVKDGQPRLVLAHVEIERQFRKAMAERLWCYYMYLRLNFSLPVIPILINLSGGPSGVTTAEWTDEVLGREVASFHYTNFGLSGCLAEEYLDRPQPLAWGLAALMRSEKWDRVEQKIRCRRAIFSADVSEKQGMLLLNLVHTYIELDGPEAERFDRLKKQELKEIGDMELTWAGKIEAKGREQGREQGRVEGSLAATRRLVLRQLEHRFGSLSKQTRNRVEALNDQQELDRLSERLLDAGSLAELGLSA